jgi:pimeloyl-ACP methyl ester carboxylesterase
MNSNDTSVRPSIVLVHGAFADGSGWHRVIPLLEQDGYTVTAVQNPLTSLADDVAATRRVVDSQPGTVVLVGHSYGGAVITAAAAGSPRVEALVYVAAFAPDAGESVGRLLGSMAPSDIGPALVPDGGGFVAIDRGRFHEVFAGDLSPAEARLLAATQKPIAGPVLETPVNGAAWHELPSWYLVATEDRAINPDLQRFLARRMRARTVEVQASHVPFLSRPADVAAVVLEAARSLAAGDRAGAGRTAGEQPASRGAAKSPRMEAPAS